MSFTGGWVGCFGYYDHSRHEFEGIAWVGPFAGKISGKDGEYSFIMWGSFELGSTNKHNPENKSPPDTPEPTPIPPQANPGANAGQTYKPSAYESLIKQISGKYPSLFTEEAVKSQEERMFEGLRVDRKFDSLSQTGNKGPNWKTVGIGVGASALGVFTIAGTIASVPASGGFTAIYAGTGITAGYLLLGLGLGDIVIGLNGEDSIVVSGIKDYLKISSEATSVNPF